MSLQNVKLSKKTIAVLLIIDHLIVCDKILEICGIFLGGQSHSQNTTVAPSSNHLVSTSELVLMTTKYVK